LVRRGCRVDSRMGSKLLERNDRADVREGWCLSRHRIAVPEPVFVQAMSQVARARFGDELGQLTSQTQVSIEEEISDPLRWSAQSNYHVHGCPACAKDSLSDGSTTQ
jgi:hypothetical protein